MSTKPALMAPADIPVINIAPSKGWFEINLAEIWQFRELIYFFVWRDLKIRYKQTLIGAAWSVFQPIMTMLVFSLFFGRLAKIPSGGLPYPIFYYSALLPWIYFAGALQNATNSIVDQRGLITKTYFPRLVLPLSAMGSGLLDFAISLVVFSILMVFYRIHPGKAILLLPVFLLLAVATALGAGLWLAALNALYRDVRYATGFLVQFWMFLSPVAYPSSLVPARWRWLYGLNPMAGVIEGFRWCLTGRGRAPSLLLAVSAGGVIVVLMGGMIFFRRMEAIFADVV
jgi:lipopolysaccharide transport system permease protein